MSMTDNTENPIPKPVRKHRKHRRRVAKKIGPFKPNTSPKSAEFAGMTAVECCDACNKDFCEISGIAVCSHPFKGGLPPTLLGNMEAVKRYNRAKLKLKNQSINPDRM